MLNGGSSEHVNFQGQRGQRSARMSGLLNRVLFTHRLQFLHKVNTLGEMVEDLGKDFRQAADELTAGISVDPKEMWNEMDTSHYDSKTCFRQSIILLKSF